jgi:predicted dinucleotide-binding enzyme
LRALENLEEEPEDVLVFADSADTRREAVELVDATGLRGIDAGPLERTRIAEALTGLLLGVNKRYGVKSTGIRITGLPRLGPGR